MYVLKFSNGLVAALLLLLTVAANADDALRGTGLMLGTPKPSLYQTGRLAEGRRVYVDRKTAFTAVPPDYVGLDYVLTAEDHASRSAAAWLMIPTSNATTVFVGYDARRTRKPAWLLNWRNTGDQWHTSAGTLAVFAKEFAAGIVTLGGNEAAEHLMYAVAFKRAPGGLSAPSVFNDAATTPADTIAFIRVLDNDKGLLDEPLVVQVLSQPQNGTALSSSRNGLVYQPDPGFTGSDGFLYRVTDADGDFDTGVVSVQVLKAGAGDQPLASNDFAVVPQGSLAVVDVLANDSGLTDQPIAVTIAAPPANGSADVTDGVHVRYSPAPGFVGVDSIEYRVTDSDGSLDTAILNVIVYPDGNIVPSAVDDERSVASGSFIGVTVLANDTGLDDTPVTVSIVAQPGHGAAMVLGANVLAYVSEPGFTGEDSLTYRVTDADGDQSDAQLTLNVYRLNSPPSISGIPALTVVVDEPYSFLPVAVDEDTSDILTFSIVNKPSWASFNTATGQLSGVPQAGDVGTTPQVVISVSDGSDVATLPAFDVTVVAITMVNASLNWDPPLLNEDGSPVDDLAGYNIYMGLSENELVFEDTVSSAATTSYIVENLVPGTYWFSVTATDLAGNESAQPPPVIKVVTQE